VTEEDIEQLLRKI